MEEKTEETPVETPTQKKSMAPFFTIGLLVAFGLLAALYFRGDKKVAETQAPAPQAVESMETQPLSTGTTVKEFTVNGTDTEFNPTTITVNKGDNVKITFIDDHGTHNLVIDGYNLSTDILGAGKQDTISFVAEMAGTFEYYCTVGNHKELGMTGSLIVQ